MIYKNSTTVTGIYLNGQQIANGYKGTIQFFGQGEDSTIEVNVTGDGLITNQLVVGKTYSVTYDLVENTPNRVFGGGYYVFAGDDTDIDAAYGDTLAGQYNYYVSEEIQAGDNPINYSGAFTFTAATTSLYGFWCLEQDSELEWDSGTVTIEEVQEEPIPNYLCFTSRADNNTIGFTASETVTDPILLQYSTDGKTWSAWDYANGGITINNGDKVYLKGINNVFATNSAYSTFSFSGTTEASGNIISLLYDDDFEGKTNLTGRDYVFYYIFNGCTNLTTAPELPATLLNQYCYLQMFYNCTSLTEAPELTATSLAQSCYYQMFYGCTSLTEAPELPATSLATYCYTGMFTNCTGLTTAPELPATSVREHCYDAMFRGCTSLTTAPELPATSVSSYCYTNMFYGCTSLTTAPELPTTSLGFAYHCYDGMFRGCTNLNYITALFTTTPSTSYTSNWVQYVSSTGTFVKNPDATWDVTGTNGVPSGWTVELYVSEEPIITVTETSSTFTISVSTASNLGTIELKVNDQLVNNPYTDNKPLYDTYYAIEATNTDSRKPSNTKTEQVLIGGTKTEDPVISYNLINQSVTASGNGTVLLYKDGSMVTNPYTFDSSEIGQTFTFTATAQESGKLISNVVSETITPEEGEFTEQTVQITIAEMVSEFGWTNSTDNIKDTDWTIKGVTFRFEKGSGSSTPKYYSSGGGAIRFYGHNILTITAGGSPITQVKFTTTATTYKFVEGDCQNASYSEDGSYQIFDFGSGETPVVINNSTSGQRRPNYFEITFIG